MDVLLIIISAVIRVVVEAGINNYKIHPDKNLGANLFWKQFVTLLTCVFVFMIATDSVIVRILAVVIMWLSLERDLNHWSEQWKYTITKVLGCVLCACVILAVNYSSRSGILQIVNGHQLGSGFSLANMFSLAIMISSCSRVLIILDNELQ